MPVGIAKHHVNRRQTFEKMRDIELPGIGTTAGVVGTEENDEAYFVYSSFIEPPRVFKTSIKDGGVEQWARVELPIDASDYEVEQVWYESADDAIG